MTLNTANPTVAIPERIDVAPVNKADGRDLYAKRKKIYPKLAFGKFRLIKWMVMAVTLGIYYAVPWIRWPRGAGLPDQAILADIINGRIFIGPIEIWPQEFYIVTGLLVLGAMALFLVTALAGRVWCGYACPQTVWTDLMIAVERFWQGDRNARIKLDAAPWTGHKLFLKTATHISWLLISIATGGAFVFYFRDAPTLMAEFVTFTAPLDAWLFLGIFTATTYLLGGLAREQVCTYMCPWPRIQGAMFDADSFLVSYRPHRGEPRGAHKKGDPWDFRGDCIDCNQCVAVCPMGIDIRDGAQLECIQCALCIDACNNVMDKVGRPNLLIAYDTFHNLDAVAKGTNVRTRIMRPRTVLYSSLIVLLCGLVLFALLARSDVSVALEPDRNPLFVRLSDNSIRNGYTIKILNKKQEPRHYALSLDGLPGGSMAILGQEGDPHALIVDPADTLVALRIYITVPPLALKQMTGHESHFDFVLTDITDGSITRHAAVFRRPQP